MNIVKWALIASYWRVQFSDQLTPLSTAEIQFSDQLTPVGTKPHVKDDLSVKNADANSF